MPARISNSCTNCALCVPVCPTKSISDGLTHHVVDTDQCEECGACAPVCPVAAIEIISRSAFVSEVNTPEEKSPEAAKAPVTEQPKAKQS